MAIDMSEVVGEANMAPERVDIVRELLSALPVAKAEIKQAFGDWARQAGYKPTARDFGVVAGARKKRRGR
ncbi:MAG: hypothetical protein K6W08_07395 [Firmicutes bacterium]|nr:hypothetical protein [Bacillota bacterium]